MQIKKFTPATNRLYFHGHNDPETMKKHKVKIAFDLHGTLIKKNKSSDIDSKALQSTLMPIAKEFLQNLEENLVKLSSMIPNIHAELAILTNGKEKRVFEELAIIDLMNNASPIESYFARGNIFAGRIDGEEFSTTSISENEDISCNKDESYGLAARLFEITRQNQDAEQIDFLYIAAAKHETSHNSTTHSSTLSSICVDDKEQNFIDNILHNFGKILGKERRKHPAITTEGETVLKMETNYDTPESEHIDTVHTLTFESLKRLEGDELQQSAKKLYENLAHHVQQTLISVAHKHGKTFEPIPLTL